MGPERDVCSVIFSPVAGMTIMRLRRHGAGLMENRLPGAHPQECRAGTIRHCLTDRVDRRRSTQARVSMNNLESSPGEVAPTPEQWQALHRAFRRYCEAEPWEWLTNETS